MPSRDIPLEQLFRVLPLTRGLASLRESVLACSRANPVRRWSGSTDYATFAKRVLSLDTLQAVFDAAEKRSVEHVHNFHKHLSTAVVALASPTADKAGALATLLQHGEKSSQEGAWDESIEYFDAIEALAIEFDVPSASILARRRLGRAWLHLGDVVRAHHWYSYSRHAAAEVHDRTGVVIAHTGLGHVLCVQGRWSDAEQEYRAGLHAAAPDDVHLRMQLAVNLSMTAREQNRLDEAQEWIDAALGNWSLMEQSDQSGILNNQALLLMARGRYDEAVEVLDRALELSPAHFDSAMILDNLAEIGLRRGNLNDAEDYARRAEEFAITGGSPRALADVYMRMGKITTARLDANGVAFFEQAVRLARDNQYSFTEGLVLIEYAKFREVMGDPDEAAGLRDAALEIFQRIGANPLPDGLRKP